MLIISGKSRSAGRAPQPDRNGRCDETMITGALGVGARFGFLLPFLSINDISTQAGG